MYSIIQWKPFKHVPAKDMGRTVKVLDFGYGISLSTWSRAILSGRMFFLTRV